MEIDVPNAVLWTPESPKLYHLNIVLSNGGRVLDRVKSYFALRKVDARKDECGYNRICLNNQPIFQYGPLDQGWWPDGLLTPPSEEAMLWDMVQLKKMGFNMIRKHIKVVLLRQGRRRNTSIRWLLLIGTPPKNTPANGKKKCSR